MGINANEFQVKQEEEEEGKNTEIKSSMKLKKKITF